MLFAVTIIFIVLTTVVAAFIRKRSRDKCLKDFWHNLVTLEEATGKMICGKLRVENTGLEFVYPATHKDENRHDGPASFYINTSILILRR